ncbi:tRNA-uridine aminocarboxypropyltransferase [Glaciecola sp. SC05]|uniref:tRNA-uridine aminocarboxypropyltransferase n=1 Tax=Glaciecola sp. SC05 TaxID=1987355 RepID=UPI0035281F4E
MTKRLHCSYCKYPLKTCVCEYIKEVDCDLHISIMQDPSEVKHAKNTARLIPLLLPKTEIFIGQHTSDFLALRRKIQQHPDTLLVYPCKNAINIASKNKKLKVKTSHIILIDGSWRKAKKIYLGNPWLQHLNAATFDVSEPSRYHIRKQSFDNGYSTIEALAYTLHALQHTPIDAFIRLQDGLQQYWQGPR